MSRVRDLADNNVVFVDGITTADITEHTNLFFTDARADARLALKMVDEDNMSSNSAAHMPTQQSVKAYVDTEVASLVDSSPSTLDTLNELAAALGDDANFSTTITNSIATKLPLAGGTMTGALIINAGDNGLDVRVGTDKRILFAGNIGEIGSVAGFQAVNTAGSANTAFGIRATDIRFATGSDERVRITDAGVGIGATSPSDKLEVSRTSTDQTVGLTLTNLQAGGYGSGIVWKSKRSDSPYNILDAAKIVVAGENSWNGDGNTASQMQFWTQKDNTLTKHMTLNKNGNLGIGDSSPTSLLSISKNSTRTTDFENMLKITHTSSGTTGVGFGSAIYFVGERENGVNQAMGRLLFDAEVNSGTNISSGFSVQTATAGSTSEKFRITHDGKVGIGTPGPSQKLEVNGNIEADGYFGDGGTTSNITFSQATSTTNPSVALWGRDHSSYPGQVHIVGRNSNANTSSGDIRFWNYNGSTWYNMFRFAYDTDNSDIRTTLQTITDTNTAIVSTQSIYNIIDSNNNQTDRAFFVSCNSDRPGNATTIIRAGEDRNIVFGQNDAGGMYNGTGSNGFGVQQAGLGGQYVVVQNTADSNIYFSKHSSYTDSRVMQFNISGSSKGSVTVASSGTTYNTTSDLRLKTDIKPIKNATSKLLEMNPVEHKWKADPEDDAVHGFIAQEMKEIIPEAVYGEPDGDEMMSMDYGRITPVIVAALQNALKEIDELKTRISELENK